MKNNLKNKWTAAFGPLMAAMMITLTLSLAPAPANGQQKTTRRGRKNRQSW